MSQVPISSLPSRKSFAQVAAAAHKPPMIKESPVAHAAAAASPPNAPTPTEAEGSREAHAMALQPPSPTDAAQQDSAEVQPSSPPKPGPSLEPDTFDNGDLRPISVDGLPKRDMSDTKSVASRTTLTIDEKESLRPDDSASVQAAVEDDSPAGSRVGSNPEARAFRDQLHEIERNGQPRFIAQRPPVGPLRSMSHAGGGIIYTGSPAPPMQSNPQVDLPRQLGGPPSGLALPPDDKLLEALASPKDRLFVLKIEQDIIDFIKDSQESFLQLPQTNSFYRMLSHKLADYYCLNHIPDETGTSVRIYRTPHCRLPPPLIGDPTGESTPPPPQQQMRKIMRRGDDTGGPRTGTTTGENTQNPSKAGSDNDSDDKDAKDRALTREERELRYNEARARIFKDFNESQAKDGESSPLGNDADQSRSSSRSGMRKTKQSSGSKKKPKDDTFEARSAYSQYGNQAYPTNGAFQAPEAFYNAFANMNVSGGFQPAPAQAAQQYVDPAMAAQHGAQMPQQPQWYPQQQYQQPYGMYPYMGQPGNFAQNPQQYANYQNYAQYGSPPVGSQTTPRPGSAAPATFSQGYPSPPSSGMWPPPQQFQASYPGQAPFYGYANGNAPPQGPPHQHLVYGYAAPQADAQYYAASQPPGAYGQPQFNPQSQAFYPGMAGPGVPGQYGPGQPNYGGHAGQMPMRPTMQMQRQLSNTSRTSGYGSPRAPYQQSPGRPPPNRAGPPQQWSVYPNAKPSTTAPASQPLHEANARAPAAVSAPSPAPAPGPATAPET